MALSPIGQRILDEQLKRTQQNTTYTQQPGFQNSFSATNMVRNSTQTQPVFSPYAPPLSLVAKALADKKKGTTISQAPYDVSSLKNTSLAKIPLLGKLLFGRGEQGNENLYDKDTFAGDLERKGAFGYLTEGFFKAVNPDREQVSDLVISDYERFIKKGIEPERALEAAFQNLNDTKGQNFRGIDRTVDEYTNPGIELTDTEKGAVQLSNAGRKIMAILDAPVFAGTTKPVTGAIKNFDGLVQEVAKRADNSLKNSVVGQRDKSLEYFRANPDAVTKGTVKLREIEDGRIVIEDGRHTLQVAEEKGLTPNFIDVTPEYTGKPSALIGDLVSKTNKEVSQKGIKVCQNCLDEATKQTKLQPGLKVEKGIYVPEAKTAEEAVTIAKSFYKENPMTTARLGKNTHAWNVDGKGRTLDFHSGKGLVVDDFKYVPESLIVKPTKSINQIDRLIAEGKVRVRMVNGRDTYEVKKGDIWKVVRDEDSAIKQMTPIPKPELPEKIQERQYELEVRKDALASDPAAALVKYVPTKGEFKGALKEVTGGRTNSAFGKRGDDIVTELGFKDSDEARAALDDYKKRQVSIKEEEAQLKADIKEAKATVSKETKPTALSPAEAKSLERLADQLQETLPAPYREKVLSLESVVAQTPVANKVGLLDFIRTPDRVLRKIGFGKEYDLIRDQYEKYIIEIRKNIDGVTAWQNRVPKDANKRIFQYLDGENIVLKGEELKVAEEIKAYLFDWADRLNLPEDNRVTSYITHLFEDQLIQKEFDEDLAKLIADKLPGSVYDPFLEKRLGAKGYKQDVWAALDAYTKRATRKVHMDVALEQIQMKAGSSLEYTNLEKSVFEYIQGYVDKVNMRPTWVDNALDTSIKQMFGYKFGQRPATRILKFFRQRTYVGMLGGNVGTAVKNLSQVANTYAVLGEKHTAIGFSKLFSAAARKELDEQGVFASNFIEDRSINATMKLIQKVDNALFIMFDTVEKINRGAAYMGAKAKYINANMRVKDGVEVWKEGASMEGAMKYGKQIVRKTQFAYDPIDAPAVLSSDISKTLLQFASYPIKQTEFLAELAKDKNFAALARYTVGGLAFVYTVGQAVGMEPKDLLPSFRFGTPPSLKFPWEVSKAALDTPDKYGNDRDITQKLKDIGNSAVGLIPGGLQIKKSVEGKEAVDEGAVTDNSGGEKFKVGNTTLSKLQTIVFGKYSTQEADSYFDKEKSPEEALNAKNLKDAREKNVALKPIYDQVQGLVAEGKTDEATEIVEGLDDAEYESYLNLRNAERASNMKSTRLKLELNPAEAVTYVRSLPQHEAQRIVDNFSDEEYERYQLGINGSTEPSEKAVTAATEERDTLELVGAYAKAFFVDPGNASKALLTKEKLGKIEGNLVELQRFYGTDYKAEGGSEEYIYEELKKLGIDESNRKDYNLEHIVPVSAGGDNSPSNLKIVKRDLHNSYTGFDTMLGNAVKDKRLTRREAAAIATDLKTGDITLEQAKARIKGAN